METRSTATPQLPVGRSSLRSMRMPPLNLLRTFEAAAWYNSFTVAAAELNMTQSAVSQQIRQLEDFLGQRLFDRLPRRLRLTPEGTLFANSVRESLTMIGRACMRLQDPAVPTSLRIEVFASLGARWFSPLLSQFMDDYPDIKLTVLASREEGNIERSGVDLSLRWGNGSWPDGRCVNLGLQPIVPVCSPAYLEAKGPFHAIEAISQHRLLQTLDRSHWPAWFEAAGLPPVHSESGPYFSDATMMLEACLDGQGVCLATFLLLERDLSAGRLVCPINLAIAIGEGFHLVSRSEESERPAARVCREWLLGAASRSLEKAAQFCPNVKMFS